MPSPRPTPIGFIVLGMAMALLAVVCAEALLVGDHGSLVRLLLALIAGLSLASAEALWWVRPWIGRVIDAWALACSSVVAVTGFSAIAQAFPLGDFLLRVSVAFVVVAAPCMLIRRYVRERAAALGVLPSSAGAAGLQPPPQALP